MKVMSLKHSVEIHDFGRVNSRHPNCTAQRIKSWASLPWLTFNHIGTGILLLVLMSVASTAVQGQSSQGGIVEGRVVNSASGVYLPDVRISLAGQGRETVTDVNGFYRISGVSAGEVKVVATYVGMETQTKTLTLAPGETQTATFELGRSEVVAMEKFEVLDRRDSDAQARALNQQRQSPNIKNVVAIDEYPTGSDDNIADFIRFIPGVSIEYSGRAGTDVSLRGMPANTSGITVDGAPLSGASM